MSQVATPPTALIFDSGVGGLSVFKEINALLPNINYTYLFDNAGFPYGELEPEVLVARTNRLVAQVMSTSPIDIVVIACNTASTIVLPSLRNKLSIPVVGVVPAIKPASDLSSKAVGLIATPATVKRNYTHQLIRDFAPDKLVKLLGTTQLVELAEAKLRGEAVCLRQLEQILAPVIGQIDVAVLGCTHFPLLQDEIAAVLGKEVCLVDSGAAIARRVMSLLRLDSEVSHYRSEIKKAYCSAIDSNTIALNNAFSALGFSPIEMIPNPDA